ncbi:MAG: hypothetical protein K940chlam6_00268 [Chlamydiae bacterium]|nr:hypothetical protein [Chlamydiota bacterium]
MSSRECGAKAKTNNHQPYRQPAMANGRCRFHGGKSCGAQTKEGKEKVKSANTKHGFYSAESIAMRKYARSLIKASYETMKF